MPAGHPPSCLLHLVHCLDFHLALISSLLLLLGYRLMYSQLRQILLQLSIVLLGLHLLCLSHLAWPTMVPITWVPWPSESAGRLELYTGSNSLQRILCSPAGSYPLHFSFRVDGSSLLLSLYLLLLLLYHQFQDSHAWSALLAVFHSTPSELGAISLSILACLGYRFCFVHFPYFCHIG